LLVVQLREVPLRIGRARIAGPGQQSRSVNWVAGCSRRTRIVTQEVYLRLLTREVSSR
jgi:hypothetical protein